ncbi:glycosyltransferase family 2 protein [Mucilaginibacter sp. L196]|uniref:glycosyltransferase family 2 protein n=1 Tax=Mucilaginibacter sp. L196 TaxID=1641870 RepID=UPI00131C6299|nr:glycosyltransferase family 2 protein [Mucilaginibacter sp. L196]
MYTVSPIPLISVIIPTYNRASILSKAIESVLNQTYTNIQLIVVDDGSEDNTEELVKSFYGIEYLLQPHSGQGKARNTGLKHAKGKYVASLDSDDTWNPTFLETCLSILEQEEFDFVFTNWVQVINKNQGFDFFKTSGLLTPYLKKSKNGWVMLSNTELRQLYINACPSPSSSLVIRRSSIITGWNEDLHIADDWCLLLDIILKRECKAAFTLQRLWFKHIDGKNIYDGRNYFEVLEQLYIKDFNKIIEIYSDRLTKKEIKEVKFIIARNIYRYTINRMINRVNVAESITMFKRAFSFAPFLLFAVLYKMSTKKAKKILGKYIEGKKQNTLELINISELQQQLMPSCID